VIARLARTAFVVAAGLVLAGCAHTGASGAGVPREEVVRLEPAEADAVIAAWNARVERLERYWARVTIVVDAVDQTGEAVREQAEGHLQIERPRNVALSLGKLGETYLYLGSNEERYWWIDAVDRDARTAITGRHDRITAAKAARLGVPVHPLELIEVIGLMPVPAGAVVERGRVAEGDGVVDLVTRAPGGGAIRRVLDPETFLPIRIEVFDRTGEVVLSALHEAPQIARVGDDLRARPIVPGRLIVDAPTVPATVRLAMYDAENKLIRAIAFDYDRLLRSFRVGDVRDLDREAAGDPARGGER
jgi:hypothetical protein